MFNSSQTFSPTKLNLLAVLVPLALTVSFVFSNSETTVQELKQEEQIPETKLSLNGEQARLLDSVFELAFQPDSRKKYRLLHRKFLNQLIPHIYVGLAWSGVNPNPTPEQAEATRNAYDFFMKEVGEVLDGKTFNMNDFEVWNDIPREKIVDLVLRLEEGLQQINAAPGHFLEDLVPFEKTRISSVDVKIQGEQATVAIHSESLVVAFEMEKNEKSWQMTTLSEESK